MRDTVETFQAVAAARGVAIESEIADELPVARFDSDRILQVLQNLVSNAIRFTPSGGTIAIRVHRDGDDLSFSVEDTGAGIAPEDIESIFGRFQQAQRGHRAGPGLGLGLYIARCIVEAHAGKIWAESQVGVGSTFRFTLPGSS